MAPHDPRPHIELDGRNYVVAGSRCVACGYMSAFERLRCPSCLSPVTPARFGPRGVVWSSTVVRVSVQGRPFPYSIAYVDLTDGPRLLAHVDSKADTALPVGTRIMLAGLSTRGDLIVRPV
jgi:uncharacterized protein